MPVITAPPSAGSPELTLWETCGAVTATSTGTTITAGGVAHTKGAYAELIAATTRKYYTLIIQIEPIQTSGYYLFDIAIGNAGSEVNLISNLYIKNNATGLTPMIVTIPALVPAGTRISARCQCSTLSSTPRMVIMGGGTA